MNRVQFVLKHETIYELSRKTRLFELFGLCMTLIHRPNTDNVDHDSEIRKYIEKNIKKSDTFLDIGANVGYFSAMALSKGAKVIAFEPVKDTFDRLKQHKDITAINKAVSNSVGSGTIHRAGINHSGSSLLASSKGEMELVHLTTLDKEFPGGIPGLKLIKIDVEGLEKEALEGGRKLLEAQKPEIIFEFSYDLLYKKNRKYDEVFDLLKEIGYTRFTELITGNEVSSHRDLSVIGGNILAIP